MAAAKIPAIAAQKSKSNKVTRVPSELMFNAIPCRI
jgi:hypothetical protein